jgi:ABC-type siderophore export system fused ATPase/permease subunit
MEVKPLNVLEIRNAAFSYDDVENIFAGINLTVDKGDVV